MQVNTHTLELAYRHSSLSPTHEWLLLETRCVTIFPSAANYGISFTRHINFFIYKQTAKSYVAYNKINGDIKPVK